MQPEPPQPQHERHRQLMTMGALEGAMAVLAVVVGYFFSFPPARLIDSSASGLLHGTLIGLAATVPMLVAFWLCLDRRWRPMRRIQRIVQRMIVPLLEGQGIAAIALLAFLAGLGEEVLFRGLIQAGTAHWLGGPWATIVGLALASLLFGLAHRITTAYFVLATLMGFYFGLLLIWTDNLWVPIITHAAYDFVAMLYYVRTSKQTVKSPPTENPN